MRELDERFMQAALDEADAAFEADEVPIGAVIVHDGRIIARGRNEKETLRDPTAHAEMLALTSATAARHDWRLTGCTMYVTLEPCPMCAGAMVLARIDRLVYGCEDPKFGACGSMFNIVSDPRTNHQIAVSPGVRSPECSQILQAFFQKQRAAGKK
jgi:tRNA(adenine34) deaminase